MSAGKEGKYGDVTSSTKEFHEGEPVFILRGQDAVAPKAIMAYAQLCQAQGCDDGHVNQVMLVAQKMRSWQSGNPGLVKDPD